MDLTYEILSGSSSGWKVLMVAQIDPINLRHRAQGARIVWPLSMRCLAG